MLGLHSSVRAFAQGAATFVPVFGKLANRPTGGSDSARYCYSVWLRHLVKASEAGWVFQSGITLAELGPGDSIGVGLSAVLSGADRYYALDAKAHATRKRNADNFEHLVRLFQARAPIPGDGEFPGMYPKLSSYAFPSHVLTEALLVKALDSERVGCIRNNLSGVGERGGIIIRYLAPWDDLNIGGPGEVDLVVSQAVLEHVENIGRTYANLRRMLKAGGFMSHSVDFGSHRLTRDWNGHWTIPDWEWKVVYGRRTYLINRLAFSEHLDLLQKTGFDVVRSTLIPAPPLRSSQLAKRFQHLTTDDLRTMGALLQARLPE